LKRLLYLFLLLMLLTVPSIDMSNEIATFAQTSQDINKPSGTQPFLLSDGNAN
jgi:hypothetical protein